MERIKNYIIVAGPIGSGKTTLAQNIAKNYPGALYLDKDSMTGISDRVTKDRKDGMFRRFLRDEEYDVTQDIALKAMYFGIDTVIVNAPYTSELAGLSAGGNERIASLKRQLLCVSDNARLTVVYIDIDTDTVDSQLRGRKDPESMKRDANMSFRVNDGKIADKQNALDYAALAAAPEIDDLYIFDRREHPDDASVPFRSLMDHFGIADFTDYDRNISSRTWNALHTGLEDPPQKPSIRELLTGFGRELGME